MAYTTIDNPSEYFNTVLFTGNGSNDHSITGVGFKPDWVWLKGRNSSDGHNLWDINRGVNKRIFTHNSNGELADTNSLKSFDSDGFTMDNDSGINGNGDTYVTWNWLASNTTASNTTGSINSTVSVNQTAGFSIVNYTGNGSGATVGHGLGTTPTWVLVKERGANGEAWNNFHQSVGEGKTIMLNLTNAEQSSTTMWNNTAPTSSVFSVGADAGSNGNNKTYIAYCFTDIKGYSKFGEYTGTGSADGPFVYTGFQPAFIIRKDTGGTEQWTMQDTTRKTFNVNTTILNPNRDNAEAGNANLSIDFLSNGFKVRSGDGASNAAGGQYIFMCFAEHPFVSSEGVPTTAR